MDPRETRTTRLKMPPDARSATPASLQREREAIASLKAIDEMKNSFLTGVSHDIRTPLAIIVGIASTLSRHVDIDKEQRVELLDKLNASAHKLQGLLSDLLDVDRLYRGTIEIHKRPTQLGLLIRNLVDAADTRSRRVSVNAPDVEMKVDPGRVERIVENLLTNAIRHTEPEAQVSVALIPQRDGVIIEVADTGPGIPDDLKDAIFRTFQRLDDEDPSPGIGLGLVLVMRFAELHGGRAWVEDNEGGGSRFKVFLPRD